MMGQGGWRRLLSLKLYSFLVDGAVQCSSSPTHEVNM